MSLPRRAGPWLAAALGACVLPPLDYEGKTCDATSPCPPPFTCLIGDPTALGTGEGACRQDPCAGLPAVGQPCAPPDGGTCLTGHRICNVNPGGLVQRGEVVLCEPDDGGAACATDGGGRDGG